MSNKTLNYDETFSTSALVESSAKMKVFLVCLVVVGMLELAECVVYGLLLSLTAADSGGRQPTTTNATSHDVIKGDSFVCKKDKHCGHGRYCHRFYGTCHDLKPLGSHCRRDHVCAHGLECVFGKCRKIVPTGQLNARCTLDKQCNQGLCCAPTHGEWLCKTMLRENEICSVSEGGIAFRINHRCPCAEGFACKKVRQRRKKRIFRLFRKERRCVKIS